MSLFWYLAIGTIVLVGVGMGSLAILARQVPDESEMHTKRRLNPDMIRLIAIGIVIIICLIAAAIELSVVTRGTY